MRRKQQIARRSPKKKAAPKRVVAKSKRRRKEGPWETSVTPLGKGRYGARLLCNGKVVMQDNSAKSKQEAARNLKSLLRMADKCAMGGKMSGASRDRFYCGPDSVKRNPNPVTLEKKRR